MFVFSSLHHRNIIFFAPVGKVCVRVCKRILKEERGNSNSSDTIFKIYQVLVSAAIIQLTHINGYQLMECLGYLCWIWRFVVSFGALSDSECG